MKEIADALYSALQTTLVSSSEVNRDGAPANIVDSVFKLASVFSRGLNNIADAIDNLALAVKEENNED